MIVQIPVNGEYRWQRLTVKSLWTTKYKNYAGVLGHFKDIQDEWCGAEKMCSKSARKTA